MLTSIPSTHPTINPAYPPRLAHELADGVAHVKRNSRTEVLLVTSRDTGRWIIPKGWPAKGKSPHKSAAREAREEAGVVGTIKRRPLGAFSYKKRLKNGKVVVCEVQVFVMKVKRQTAGWLEKGQRRIKWLPRTKAAKTVGDRLLGTIIRTLPKK